MQEPARAEPCCRKQDPAHRMRDCCCSHVSAHRCCGARHRASGPTVGCSTCRSPPPPPLVATARLLGCCAAGRGGAGRGGAGRDGGGWCVGNRGGTGASRRAGGFDVPGGESDGATTASRRCGCGCAAPPAPLLSHSSRSPPSSPPSRLPSLPRGRHAAALRSWVRPATARCAAPPALPHALAPATCRGMGEWQDPRAASEPCYPRPRPMRRHRAPRDRAATTRRDRALTAPLSTAVTARVGVNDQRNKRMKERF